MDVVPVKYNGNEILIYWPFNIENRRVRLTQSNAHVLWAAHDMFCNIDWFVFHIFVENSDQVHDRWNITS